MSYPSQYEAQLIVDTRKALDDIFTGYASDTPAAEVIENAKNALQEHWLRVFLSPETSPWEIDWYRKRGELVAKVVWRSGWQEVKQ